MSQPSWEARMKGKTTSNRRSTRNGNHGGGNGERQKPHTRVETDELKGQPSIISLLAPGKESPDARRALDKGTLLAALAAFKKGDFSVRLPNDLEGMDGKIADTFNDVIEQNQRLSQELERLSRVVGKEGKISQRAS